MYAPSGRPEPTFLAPPAPDQARSSIISNLSRFWKSRAGAPITDTASDLPARSVVVPLFMSASRSSGRNNLFERAALPMDNAATRSSPPTSISDVPQPLHIRAQPSTDHDEEGSDMYGPDTGPDAVDESVSASTTRSQRHINSAGSRRSPRSGGTRSVPSARSSARSARSGRTGSQNSHNSRTSTRSRRIFSRRAYRDRRVNAKAKICFAFGITLIVAAIIYLVLAFTGIARNTTFHVLSILLILVLTGVFCHQLVRMFMLIKAPRRHAQTAAQRRRHATRERSRKYRQQVEETIPEKPIQIHMASDHGDERDLEAATEVHVPPPPPVYGNFRGSIRMNPDYIHWRHVPPSPLTPSYNEAVGDVHPSAEYRPPSYLSEGGVSEMVESQSRDVDAALHHIHPLERERIRNLTVDALEGRNRI
ncbi:hypothetical protein B0A52_06277 [Exophiala mesophila]|uniref:Uncharacterized protein n=1 Tax=Exophiala mesophila TaxID=212818 RepID=A0A438N382_EXOME|nr:hypothetical protein B0A52_06277 [Exophiala mesophila]